MSLPCFIKVGRLPDGDKGTDHLEEIFYPKGFDDTDIVALSGAHTVKKTGGAGPGACSSSMYK